MKRRQAIHGIATISAGAFLFSSCDLFDPQPVYSNIPLERSQRHLISQLSEAILPKQGLEVVTPELTLDFVLTMVNDCYSPEDIEKYIIGMKEFEIYLEQNYTSGLDKIESSLRMEILKHLEKSDEISQELKYFYTTTKRLTVQHFTSSDYFMTNYLDYEMVPGRYFGCTTI
jgi:hypothetical protein